jgi:nicotinate-nucleotide adenylyltransferase
MVEAPLTARRPAMRLEIPRPRRPPTPARPLRVGLLGGSFNPAHDGHVYLSVQALRRLELDQVWWLVSPQNPLKPRAGMAPFADRLARAREIVRHPRIRVLDLEARLGTHYSIDTLRRLRTRPGTRFVWLIGADNLRQLPRWRHWRQILETVPVAAFDRTPYSYGALVGEAASRFAAARIDESRLHELSGMTAPAWAFVRLRAHPASSTAIRQATGGRVPRQEVEP